MQPRTEQLDRMGALVRQGMEDGSVGDTTSLSYPPAIYDETAELI